MNNTYREWFINNRDLIQEHLLQPDRSYRFTNIHYSNVPFHNELKHYIYSLNDITKDTYFEYYHIHTWIQGDYFQEHMDSNFRRKWAYVCELQPSDCHTSLMVEGIPVKQQLFDSHTLHEVPMIKKGERISLTVFGSTTSLI